MTPVVWADWIDAGATVAATVVTLYFGVRDHGKHEAWKTARREFQKFARGRLRRMGRSGSQHGRS